MSQQAYFLHLLYICVLLYCLVTLNCNDFLRSVGFSDNENSWRLNERSQTGKSLQNAGFTSASDSIPLINNYNGSVRTHESQFTIQSLVAGFIQKNIQGLMNFAHQVQRAISCIANKFKSVFVPAKKLSLPSVSIQSDNDNSNLEPPSTISSPPPSTQPQRWAGKPVTPKEQSAIQTIRQELSQKSSSLQSQWAKDGISDIDILRFLRGKNHHIAHTIKALLAHDTWRVSPYGAESSFVKEAFPFVAFNENATHSSPLRQEAFWLGPDQNGCPTLVIRTQVHDGYYYNEDPKIYTGYIIALLEESRRLYGVGTDRQMCVLMDRGGTVFRNNAKKIEKLDMAVLPNLISLFKHLYSTVMENYPEVLYRARIAPASWFFSACYRITSTVMAPSHRERFQMIKESELKTKLHPFIALSELPKHLGGHSEVYQSTVNINFDPQKSYFPIKPLKEARNKKGKANSIDVSSAKSNDKGNSNKGSTSKSSSQNKEEAEEREQQVVDDYVHLSLDDDNDTPSSS